MVRHEAAEWIGLRVTLVPAGEGAAAGGAQQRPEPRQGLGTGHHDSAASRRDNATTQGHDRRAPEGCGDHIEFSDDQRALEAGHP
ncbi:hypothetical protein [Mycobacterium avium]|uniref:hypothetical protein n=1 Tax=Mycobacterium avium TaxID=1764 RepID=UPI0009B69B01|nr:hypothetical protein [Mycobacterium avium]TXA43641.1 hypothetical protein DKM27_01200 [Mycobacterium tuberculosis variant bovis]